MTSKKRSLVALCASVAVFVGVAYAQTARNVSGPADQGPSLPQTMGDANLGRAVFRTETFGNEGFWTDAVRLPAGIAAAGVTPMQALDLGLQVDVDAVDPATKAKLAAELRADPSGRSSTILNDPAVTGKLIMANAVMGMSPQGGSIGHRVDGPANHVLNIGAIFATAANTRALYPTAQLALNANKGKSLGRAPRGLSANATEADFDAYFSNPEYYPIGMFDDTPDGNGNPMHNTPLFRQDLAAPYGSEGTFTKIDDFSNLVFSALFDQTMLTTPGGQAFIHGLAGPAGDEMLANYAQILKETGVTGYPFVRGTTGGKPGTLSTPIGFRVDNRKLLALNAYLSALRAPAGERGNPQAAARGRAVFVSSGCTMCHNADQGRPVPTFLRPMAAIWPGDRPVIMATRKPPLNPVQDTPGNTFDDKWAVVNASQRGEKRGVAMPLLLDLARKPVFLHDNSVGSLEALFNPSRGNRAPHPFYVTRGGQRSDLTMYLRSLDTSSR